MNVLKYLSPLRLEIRVKSATADAPWHVLGVAQTQGQGEDALKRHKISAEFETRIVPNDPVAVADAVVKDTPATLQLVEQYGVENMTLRRELNEAKSELEAALKDSGRGKPAAPEPAAAALKKPFAVGDTVRDVHTGVAHRVTHDDEPHPQIGNPERVFKLVNLTTKEGDTDHTSAVPFKSAGCFEKVGDHAKPVKKPSHDEHPTPAAAKVLAAEAAETPAHAATTEPAAAPVADAAHAPNKPRATKRVPHRSAAQPGRSHKAAPSGHAVKK